RVVSLDYLDRLARFARRVRLDDLSESAVTAAKAVVLDTLGAILAGSRLGENGKLADLAIERSGHRSATILGRARKAEPMFAALAVARLLGHEPAALRDVINLATSMSPANTWTPCFEGATIRNVYPGRAGLQGILATHLLDCGFTPIADAPSDVYGTLLADGF